MVKKIALKTIDSQEWETPQSLFDELNAEFDFDLDPCATPKNAKCKRFFTKKDDGLKQDWYGAVFVNPPFRHVSKWVEKSYKEASRFKVMVVVMLLPARTDTRWFHKYCYENNSAEIRFLKGRLKFGNSKNSAPFPSMIVIFK